MKNITIAIGAKNFVMKPEGYLLDAKNIAPEMGEACIFAFMPSPAIAGSTYQVFLLGDTFLRNFYSVYDIQTQKLSLAVDVNAKDIAEITDRKNPLIPYSIALVVTQVICLAIYIFFTQWNYQIMVNETKKPKQISEENGGDK